MPSDERERRATLTPRAAVDKAHVQFLAGFPMNNAVATLDLVDRIAGAFRDAPASSDIAILITEVEAASLSSKEAAERARERAIDPALSAEDVAHARQAMEDAAFARDRLAGALPRLQQRRKELLAAEEDAQRRAHCNSLEHRFAP